MGKEKKTERLQLRLSPTDKRNISYHAKLMDISVNEYLSLLIRRKRIVICENFPELIYQLSKIGTNINQIAAIANTNEYISIKNVDEVKSLMKECYGVLSQFISFISEPEKEDWQTDTETTSQLLSDLVNSVQSIDSRLLKIEGILDN